MKAARKFTIKGRTVFGKLVGPNELYSLAENVPERKKFVGAKVKKLILYHKLFLTPFFRPLGAIFSRKTNVFKIRTYAR